ncbi:hypothetical protein EW146_g2788 [Bondarzewia mesenterica]|uniref:RING-type domain-containing protein n=1 Tax=Bondarzewia mesenterica TaxID=1095465 RepID=A0A4S4LZV5_9AGAM|nr:hypothetical protein EW146_g2788 [Bondarzewia mesenterica]
MSSTDPPQLHINLPSNTTSFKRSFEEFGFDLDSPIDASGGSASGSNDNSIANEGGERCKRARSESSSSGSLGISGSSSMVASSSGSSRISSLSGHSRSSSPVRSAMYPPAVASVAGSSAVVIEPSIVSSVEEQDVEMTDSPPSEGAHLNFPTGPGPDYDEQFRVSMERFNAFDTEISALRQRSTPIHISPSPPPTLPPLALPSPRLEAIYASDTQSNLPLPSIRPRSSNTSLPGDTSDNAASSSHAEDRGRHSSARTSDGHLFIYPTFHSGSLEPIWHSIEVRPPATEDISHRSGSRINARTLSPSRSLFPPRDTSPPPAPSSNDLERDIPSPFSISFEQGSSIRPERLPSEESRQRPSGERRSSWQSHYYPTVRRVDDGDELRPPAAPRLNLMSLPRRDFMGILIPESSPLVGSHQEASSLRDAQSYEDDDAPPWTIFRNDARRAFRADLRRAGRSSSNVYRDTETVPNSILSARSGGGRRAEEVRERHPSLTLNLPSPPSPLEVESLDPASDLHPGGTRHPGLPDLILSEETQPLLPRSDRQTAYLRDDDDRGRLAAAHRVPNFSRVPQPARGNMSPGPTAGDSGSELNGARAGQAREASGLWGWYPPVSTNPRPRSAWRTFSGNDRLQEASEPEPPSASRSRIYPIRPSQSNSLMSENAAEWRRSLARSELLLDLPLDQLTEEDTDVDRPSSRRPLGASSLFTGEDVLPRSLEFLHRLDHLADADSYADSSLTRPSSDHRESSLSSWERIHPPLSPNLSLARSSTERQPSGYRPGPVNLSRPTTMAREPSPPTSNATDFRRNDLDDALFYHRADALFAARPALSLQGSEGARVSEARTSSSRPDINTSGASAPSLQSLPWENPARATSFEPSSSSELRRRATLRSSLNPPSVSSTSPPPASSRPTPSNSSRRPPSAAPSTASRQDRSSSYRNIDLNAYHEGPFRASLERLVEIERLRSRISQLESLSNEGTPRRPRPPALPPLRFDFDDLSAFDDPSPHRPHTPQSSREGMERRSNNADDSHAHRPVILSPVDDNLSPPASPRFSSPGRLRRLHLPLVRRLSPLSTTTPPTSIGRPPNAASAASELRDRRQIHSLFSRRPRLEASRIADDDLSSNGGDVEGFSHAIALLRADGLTNEREQQLIDRFRERSEDHGRPSSHWGDLEGEGDRSIQPRPYLISRLSGSLPPPPEREIDQLGTRGGMGSRPMRRSAPLTGHRVSLSSRISAREGAAALERIERIERMIRAGGRDGPSVSGRGRRSLGDFIRDEDFDTSYESLLSLAATLGEVKPRCTPDNVIASLPTGLYKEWANSDSDHRCPICLDDYMPNDSVMKLSDCSHWLHKGCLEVSLRLHVTPVILSDVSVSELDSNGFVVRPHVLFVVGTSEALTITTRTVPTGQARAAAVEASATTMTMRV